jgi:hypothetical protein
MLRAIFYALSVPLPLFVREKEIAAWIGNLQESKRCCIA